jgi:hypothetical protein
MKKSILTVILALLLGCSPESGSTNTINDTTNTDSAASNVADSDIQVKYLGQRRDKDGTLLDGYAILHPRRKAARKKPPRDKGGNESCYSFITSSKISWKTPEPYLIDPTNQSGLGTAFVVDSIHQAVFSWDSQVGKTIFGPEVLGLVDRASLGNTANGQNELIFAAIDDPGVIAVTYVWGIFSGPPRNREFREWDMILDDVDFSWGNAGPTDENNLGNTAVMDLLNILTHEFGHALGLGHPSDTCTEETMFRFSQEGETKARTLHAGDIAGVNALYGQ